MAQGTPSTTAAARRELLLVDLALQGGGAHGAFTWGVIDRLLEEPWLEFDGISAPRAPDPLEAVLAESVDFGRLARAPIKLFITATNVRTGRGRVFRNADITPRVLLASACLPTLFQAVEIDGEAYWDGGYLGNPTITPLVRECRSQDTIIVPINPVERPGTPRRARQILNRLNEVSFNAVLLKELRMIALLRQIADPGDTEGARRAGMRVQYASMDLDIPLGEV